MSGRGKRGPQATSAPDPKRSSEFDRIARLAERFARDGAPATDRSILRGIGDDAAVLDLVARAGSVGGDGAKLVWTVDAQVEGVHFRPDLASWNDVGWRSFMAAASDLAAMGASPWCALSAVVLPSSLGDDALEALTAGQAEASRAIGAPIVGGNLARGGETSITTTLLGTSIRPCERTAKVGDGIWVAGALGLAAAGLAVLERKLGASEPEVARAVLAWRRPRALIAEGVAMAEHASGAIDVSDGLVQDIAHVAGASRLGAAIDEDALRRYVEPPLGAVARLLGADPLPLALHGGEDYALVAASARVIEGFSWIGRFEEGEGVTLVGRDKAARSVRARGFDHFR